MKTCQKVVGLRMGMWGAWSIPNYSNIFGEVGTTDYIVAERKIVEGFNQNLPIVISIELQKY